jgi:hypothetical protein
LRVLLAPCNGPAPEEAADGVLLEVT